ncbi:MAG: hypothetical protein KC587_11375, partial [Nitrospira sp.]|nr:hypothetical protein [Nitrospira sp.]
LPILASVEGRISDVLYTIDGKQIGRLGRIFQDDLHIHEAQIIQEKLDQIRICFVPTPGFTLEDGRTLVDLLRARMGKVEVILEKVPEVPRGVNGKFRTQICKLSQEEKAALPKNASPSASH